MPGRSFREEGMIPSIVGLAFVIVVIWAIVSNDRKPGGGGGGR